MTTVEERREVARRLRETGEELWSSALLWYHIAKILGVRDATDGKTACDMLADLIDPDCGTQEADSSPVPEHNADLIKMVDRDALLKLADEMYINVLESEEFDIEFTTSEVESFARRIREACGEVEG